MNPPKIFISATSGDLSSARQIAKEALLTINCHPVEQTNFEPDWRSVTDMLRGKISDCQALIHLVGFRYGAEPDPATLPGGTPRRSYTQMEYHLARELGLRVYTFLLPETYPFDVSAKADTPEQTQLQAAHRALIQSSPHLYEKPANDLDLRTRLIALHEQVISLEQEQQNIAKEVKTSRHWGLWAGAAMLLILCGIGVWLNIISHKQDEQTKLVKDQSNLLREAVVQLEQLTEEKARLGIKITELPLEAVEKELAARVGISAVELRLNIEAGKRSQDALTRAHANLLAGKLADAHTAADEVLATEAPAIQRIVQAHEVHGQAYFREGNFEASLVSFQNAAGLINKAIDPIVWAAKQEQVASTLDILARYKESEPLKLEVLRLREHNVGINHIDTAAALRNLASLFEATNRIAQAEEMYRRALKIDETLLGPNHPEVANDLSYLAELLRGTKRPHDAELLMNRALRIDQAKEDADKNPAVARDLSNLAQLFHDMHRFQDAELLYRKALKIDEAFFKPGHPNVAVRQNDLAQLLMDCERFEEAEPLMKQALESATATFGSDHPKVALRLSNLGELQRRTGRFQEAEQSFRLALKIDEAFFTPDHPKLATRLNNLALVLKAIDRLSEAEPLYKRSLAIFVAFRHSTGYEHPNFNQTVENYRSLLFSMELTNEMIEAKLRDSLVPNLPKPIK